MQGDFIGIRDALLKANMGRQQGNFVIAMLNNRTNIFVNYLNDIRHLLIQYNLDGDKVLGGSEINTLYQEVVLNADN